MFSQIYSILCENNKSRKENYKKYSGLHEHHEGWKFGTGEPAPNSKVKK
jgi:hypothetical protein